MSVIINSVDSRHGGFCEVYTMDDTPMYMHPDAHSLAVMGRISL